MPISGNVEVLMTADVVAVVKKSCFCLCGVFFYIETHVKVPYIFIVFRVHLACPMFYLGMHWETLWIFGKEITSP